MNETTHHQAASGDTVDAVIAIISVTLGIEERAAGFDSDTPLFGGLPELDSMAVVELVTVLEDQFAIVLDDGDITGDAFATVGSLATLIDAKRS